MCFILPSGHRDRLGLWGGERRRALFLRPPGQRQRPEAVLGDEFHPETAGALDDLHVAVQVQVRINAFRSEDFLGEAKAACGNAVHLQEFVQREQTIEPIAFVIRSPMIRTNG